MESNNQYLHEVVITAIIVKDGKYLITRRSLGKKRFPGMWTVPGGKLETKDYLLELKKVLGKLFLKCWLKKMVVLYLL